MGTIRSPWLSYGKSMKPMGIAAKNQTGPWKMTTKITLYMWISIYNNFTIFFQTDFNFEGEISHPAMFDSHHVGMANFGYPAFALLACSCVYIYIEKCIDICYLFSSGLTQYYISQADCWFYKSHFYWWIPPLLIVHPGNLTAPPCKNPAPSPSQS